MMLPQRLRLFSGLSAALLAAAFAAPPVASAADVSAPALPAPLVTSIQRSDYGVDVFSYDSQLNAPSTVPALKTLGMGMQQFPNANEWSWVSNSFRSGGQAPVSLADWGQILQETGNQGLFIFDYDENPTFTGGGSPSDAAQLTQYIVSHQLPITAIVIGSEEYGSWDHYANLNPSFSAQYYATQARAIAEAIHAVDPAMQVGVSFDPSSGPNGLWWNQTVLRIAGPYINFVSVHDYPNQEPLSNSALLSSLPGEIAQEMAYVKAEIAANVPWSVAQRLQIWVTEFNPYGQPGPQSVAPVYGAAMVESALLWRALGAAKLFFWSYDGQAHVASPGWPVASNADAPFGLFALAGDGEPPELPMNALYPSGQALAQLMQAIGNGGTLSLWWTSDSIVGQIQSGGQNQVFAVNTASVPDTLPLNTGTVLLPPAALTVIPNAGVVAGSQATASAGLFANSLNPSVYQPVIPAFAAPASAYPGEVVTISGRGFGAPGPGARVMVSENGINYGGPGDVYGVAVTHWSPHAISFVVPNGASGPPLTPGVATVRVITAHQVISAPEAMAVEAPPVLPLTLSAAAAYPGEVIALAGQGFGRAEEGGYVEISEDGVNYGAPSNVYKLTILQWSPDLIRVVVPDGTSGPALGPGTATVTVVNSQGLKTAPLSFAVAP
ncbi:MAG: cell surface protein [Firmicutes bacterium]|nr:cell surface protein [Bacillota bacterium]